MLGLIICNLPDYIVCIYIFFILFDAGSSTNWE